MIRMVIFALAVSAVVLERPVPESTPVVGGPCEGCEAVFQGMPDPVTSHARIAPASEPGAPMMIEGVVVDASGVPVEGVIVYAYHTDDRGIYPRDERFAGQAAYRHGRLRGWAITDADGRYSFDTIRPAGYPETSIPAHVHMHVIEVGRCTYYIDDINFEDDPRLTPRERDRSHARGGSGLVSPRKDSSGVWMVTRDIRLGENIPGYPGETSR
jgi:protocatechuate 3,4-dioxygenase beta subunit